MERYTVYTVNRRAPARTGRPTVSSRSAPKKVKNKTHKLSFNLEGSRQYIALMVLIIIGIVLGAFYVKASGISKTALDGTGFFMQDLLCQNAAARSFMSLSVSAFFPVALMLCLSFVFGLCAIGMPFEVIITALFGFWTGACMSSVYMRYGIRGLGICLVFILPQTLINTVAILISSKQGLTLTDSIYKTLFKGENKLFSESFKKYCSKFVICFGLIVVSSIVEAAAIKIFALIFFS